MSELVERLERLEGQVAQLQSDNADLREKIKNLTGNRKKMKPPTLAEIAEHVMANRLDNVNPEQFFNHYEENGWMMGEKGLRPMRSWKRTLRTWNTNNYGGGNRQQQQSVGVVEAGGEW